MQKINDPNLNSKLKNKNITIIGGAGFIGHNLSLKLKDLNANVTIIDSLQVNNLGYYTTNYITNPNSERYIAFINERLSLIRKTSIPLHIIDARDYHLLSKVLSATDPDVIIHLAAVSHANRSNKDPFSTFDHSLRTLENALDVSRDKLPQFIYFSSSMVYGNFDGESVTEDRICNPLGIYASLKFSGEKIVMGYNQVFNLPYTIIRPSALYGERCVSRRVGQSFIENALSGKDLNVNGDGNDSLDFTYIDDLIQGIILTIDQPKAINQVFNITYGSSRKINQLADIVQSSFPKIKTKYNPKDELMPERGTLNIDKARKLLGYKPNFPLEIGFMKYINWYKDFAKENPKLFINQ